MGENEVNGRTGRRMGWQYYPLHSDRYGVKEFQAGSLAGTREFSWSDVKEVKLTSNETGVLLLLQGIAEIIRCVLCIKTGVWPARLHDVEETESIILREQELHKDDPKMHASGKGAGQ